MSTELLYDLAELREMSGNNPEFIDKLIRLFETSVPEIIAGLEHGLLEADYQKVYAAAHKAKPSIDLMGIHSLRDIIREVEQNALHGVELDVLPDRIAKIKGILREVLVQLGSR